MSWSPKSSLLRQKIEQDYEKKMRVSSFRWLAVNGVMFLVFAYDLCCLCSSYTTVLHYVELCAAAVLAANMILHALRLTTRSAVPSTLPCTPARKAPSLEPLIEWPADALALPRPRDQASPTGSPPHSTPSPSPSPPSPAREEFIADRRTLAVYLRQHDLSAVDLGEQGAAMPGRRPDGEPLRPRSYHLAPLDTTGTDGVADSSMTAVGGESTRGAGRSPQALRRLQLEPQRVTQYLLNLRLWLHVTILERLVREADRLDAALAAVGAEARVGGVSLERLAAAAQAAPAAPARLAALLPFLEPFADQRYFVRRLRELARGGCLSGYRWDGGGTDWEDSRPTDAELVLQLFASYMDTQLPGGGRPFSAAHLSEAPAAAPRGPRALAVHRVTRRPPHYVLALPDEQVEAARGRDNLLLTLLVFVAAAAARADPPALQRVHLGRAGLNLLWVIGR